MGGNRAAGVGGSASRGNKRKGGERLKELKKLARIKKSMGKRGEGVDRKSGRGVAIEREGVQKTKGGVMVKKMMTTTKKKKKKVDGGHRVGSSLAMAAERKKKRKMNEEGSVEEGEGEEEKKEKKVKKREESEDDDDAEEMGHKLPKVKRRKRLLPVPPLDGSSSRKALSDWLWQSYLIHFGKEISSLEKEEIAEDRLVELSRDKDRAVTNLVWHLKRMFGSTWGEVFGEGKDLAPKTKGDGARDEGIPGGSPAVLIICSSAMRCVDVLKALRDSVGKRGPRLAKLFAKHLKVEDQVQQLKDRVDIAAGTPARLQKLVSVGALALDRLRYLILDMHRDEKTFTMFDIREVRDEFWNLYRSCLHQRVLQKQLQICLY
ncbi:hypothetical protein CBR_g19109 [Chara braunii]|uniref:Protein CMSS1 n=1 Tax=Chara braunii TaxID=69332 RepID=A0A388KXC0_CHABU|nr:hypothetical protein CBR_g19109 [Chara braunii]|eukprot:GBG74704.1 hypothetical protein CBR_g19109 [Chara braunii]